MTTRESGSPSDASPPRINALNAALCLLLVAAAARALAPSRADPDLWGHVRYGQDLLRTGRIVQKDTYSYTADRPWINHEWLCEAVFAAIYNAVGPRGLVALRFGLCLLLAWGVYAHARRYGLEAVRAAMLTLLVILAARYGLNVVRPQLFTYVSWLVVVWVIHQAEQGRPGWLAALPPLFALWINLHGGVLAGLGLLGVWAAARLGWDVLRAGRVSAAFTRPNLWIIACSAASAAALLLNPYGWRLLLFLARTATKQRPYITEWQPLRLLSLEGAEYLALLAVAAASLLATRRPRRPAAIAAFAAAAVLPLSAIRHITLFALAAAVLNAEHIADAWARWMPRSSGDEPRVSPVGRVAAALAFAAALWYFGMCLPYFRGVRIGVMPFPARAAALLRDSGVEGNLAVYFDWGQYALWHLGPRIKVSMDGRRETVYSDAVYKKDLQFRFGVGPKWDAMLKDYPTQMALLDKRFACFNLMKLLPEWRLAYEDPLCGLFVRKGSPQDAALADAKPNPDIPYDGVGCYFPGP